MEMKYNKCYEDGDFTDYLKYLDTIKNDVSIELYNFMSDPDRHNFSEKSLHDSLVEEIVFKNDLETEASNIIISLICENCKITLCFYEVIRSDLKQDKFMDKYNDLITWEIGKEKFVGIEKYYEEEPPLVFRAMFSGYGEIEIYCKNIKIEEIIKNKI